MKRTFKNFFGLFFLVILILFLSSCAFDSGLTGGVITGKAGSTADDVKVLKMPLRRNISMNRKCILVIL